MYEKPEELLTVNPGQVFLSQVPRLIAIFVITFAISKKFVANLLRNIANLLSQLKTPPFRDSSLPIRSSSLPVSSNSNIYTISNFFSIKTPR